MDCVLEFGINMSGMVDWGMELFFVDLMYNVCIWYIKDVDNFEYFFDLGYVLEFSYWLDGYLIYLL